MTIPESPDDYILAAFLPEAECRALEARAAGQKEAEEEIAASFRLRNGIESGSRLERADLDDALVIFSMLSGRADHGWLVRLRERIEANPRAREALVRLDSKVGPMADAGEHFKKLTGHEVDGPVRPRWVWLTAAALAALVVAHGAFTRFQEDALARAVWRTYLEAPAYRDAAIPAGDIQLVRQVARDSRKSILGLWPRYDAPSLIDALSRLEGRADPSAVLERARLEILLGRTEAALSSLEGISDDGFAAPEKTRLLDLMGRHQTPDGP